MFPGLVPKGGLDRRWASEQVGPARRRAHCGQGEDGAAIAPSILVSNVRVPSSRPRDWNRSGGSAGKFRSSVNQGGETSVEPVLMVMKCVTCEVVSHMGVRVGLPMLPQKKEAATGARDVQALVTAVGCLCCWDSFTLLVWGAPRYTCFPWLSVQNFGGGMAGWFFDVEDCQVCIKSGARGAQKWYTRVPEVVCAWVGWFAALPY